MKIIKWNNNIEIMKWNELMKWNNEIMKMNVMK